MADHLSVGVQTWGSAILLGREMARRPESFGLFLPGGGLRVLELGAGTGLLSILCRKLLDLHHASLGSTGTSDDLVVATDFHPDVLSNLKICVDLNFPPQPAENRDPITSSTDISSDSGIHISKLDWSTFPAYMEKRKGAQCHEDKEEMARFVNRPFDLVLASDCVYDPTHAAMLRKVAPWVLRPPPGAKDKLDPGGTFVSNSSVGCDRKLIDAAHPLPAPTDIRA